jgi:carboxymethylenebutenolidase
MDRKMVALFGQYAQGILSRREFLGKLAVLAGSTAAACAILPILEEQHANAAMVAPNDSRLKASHIRYAGSTGDVKAYWVRTKGSDKRAGIVVVPENKGLTPHIEDVARRLALEGFLAAAPDALSLVGGTPADKQQAVEMIRKLDPQKTLENFIAAVRYLDSHPECTGKVGVVGFCWGGAMANQLAVHSEAVDAAVPYYGRQPAAGEVPKIKASLLLHYAGLDERINKGIPAYETALKVAGVDYQIHMYAGAKHAFNNDANPGRYHKAAAEQAWKRTVAFFKEKLGAG